MVGAGFAVSIVVAVFMATLARPDTAHAEVPLVGELPVIGPAVNALKAGAETLLDPVETALSKVLQAIFGGIEAKLITGVINGLLTIPNFDTGHVAALEHTTVAIAAGMLGAVLTLSILRYYLAGLSDSGSGGFEAIQGLIRVIGAVGFIIAWSSIFAEIVQIPKAFDGAILGSGSVQHSVALLFDAALVIGAGAFALDSGLGLIFVVLIAFIAAVVFIALLWMKVLVSVMMMFLYVSMPLCVVLWPVPELSWLAVAALRSLFVALLVPCVWAILFALSSAVNADVLTWAPSHSIVDTVIIRPLAGITLMLLCITIPRFLIRTAMIGPHGQAGGGWRVWRTLTFGMFAMRGATGAAKTVALAAGEGHATAQRMIDALPAQLSPPSGPGEGSLAGRVMFGRSGFAKNPTPAEGNSEGQQDQQNGGGSGGERTVRPEMQLAGVAPASFDRERIDRAGKEMYDQAHSAPSSAAQVSSAMGQLPSETQHAIAEFRNNDPQKLRDLMAHNLHSPSLSEDQHQALWTIGTARHQTANEGINAAITTLNQQAATPASTPTTSAATQPTEQQANSDSPTTASKSRDALSGSPQAAQSSSPQAGTGSSQGPVAPPTVTPGATGAASAPAPIVERNKPVPAVAHESSGDNQTGRGIGTDLPQQPSLPNQSSESGGTSIPDIEPFLD